MAVIGNWGMEITFSVSDMRVFTFDGLTRSIASEWAEHSRIGKKSQPEYLRPALQKITFDMTLDATHGVRPRQTLETLETHCERGLVYPLVIGGKRVGENLWRVTELSEAWETVLNGGELVRAKVSVTMEEYL